MLYSYRSGEKQTPSTRTIEFYGSHFVHRPILCGLLLATGLAGLTPRPQRG